MKTSSSFFIVSPIFCETVAAISQAVDPSFTVPLYVWLKVFYSLSPSGGMSRIRIVV